MPKHGNGRSINVVRFFKRKYLPRHKGKQPHESGALDGSGKLALIFGRDAGTALRSHSGVRIYELFQSFHIFVVNMFYVV